VFDAVSIPLQSKARFTASTTQPPANTPTHTRSTGVPDWPNQPRVTVIGDAAHSMTPAGGIGANTAVRDAALLGRLLVEAGGYREGITETYEREMRVYASEAVRSSYAGAKMQFGVHIDENSPRVHV